MHRIPLSRARAIFSAVVDRAREGQPSIITRRGRPVAVVLGFEDWQRLSQVPSFGRLLMAAPLELSDIPDRHIPDRRLDTDPFADQ